MVRPLPKKESFEIKKVGKGIANVAKDAGKGVATAGQTVGKGAATAGQAVGKGAVSAANFTKNLFGGLWKYITWIACLCCLCLLYVTGIIPMIWTLVRGTIRGVSSSKAPPIDESYIESPGGQ
jgi:hypothetical protein